MVFAKSKQVDTTGNYLFILKAQLSDILVSPNVHFLTKLKLQSQSFTPMLQSFNNSNAFSNRDQSLNFFDVYYIYTG